MKTVFRLFQYRFFSSILFMALLFVLSTSVFAMNRTVYSEISPVAMLENSIHKILVFLARDKNITEGKIAWYVNNEIAPNFDFDYMTRWIAGRYYQQMNSKQRNKLKQAFARKFLDRFVQRLSQNRHALPQVSHFVSEQISANEAVASAMFRYRNGQTIKADFLFEKTPSGWKVVDIKANGLSALLYYRQYFQNRIRQQFYRSPQRKSVYHAPAPRRG